MTDQVYVNDDEPLVTDAQKMLSKIRDRTNAKGIPWNTVLLEAQVSDRAYYYWVDGRDIKVHTLMRIERAADALIKSKELNRE